MGLFSHRDRLVETRKTRPTLMTRLKGPNAKSRTVKTTTKIEPESVVAARNGGRIHHTHGHHTHGHHHGYTHNYNTRRSAAPVVAPVRKRNVSLGDKVLSKITGGPRTKTTGSRRVYGTNRRGLI